MPMRAAMPMPLMSLPQRLLYAMTAVQSGDTVNAATAGVTETPFQSSFTVTANSLSVGDTITMRGYGLFTATLAGPTQRARIRLGSSLLIDVGALGLLASVPNARYDFDCLFTVRSLGATGTLEAEGCLRFVSMANGQATVFLAGPTPGGSEAANPVTVNTTVDNVLRLTTQFGLGAAGNSNTLRQMQVMLSKAPS